MPNEFDVNDLAVALKKAEGLPTSDVNIGTAPSVAQSVNQPNQTVVQQNANVATILQDAQAKASAAAAPQESEMDRILAMKDKAIEDLKSQNSQLNLAQKSQLDKIEGFLTKGAEKPQEPAPIDLPGLPENVDDLPAELQLKAMQDTIAAMKTATTTELKTRDENLRKMLGPLANEVNQMRQIKDRNQVMDQFPNFDYDANINDINALRTEVPAMTAIEAASVVGSRVDVNMLLPSEAAVPEVMGSRPSMEAASGTRGSSAPQEDKVDIADQLKGMIVSSHQSGNTAQAAKLTEALLKQKLGY